jgi:hypothetical protein
MNKPSRLPKTAKPAADPGEAHLRKLVEQACALAQQAKGKLGVTPETEREFPLLVKQCLLHKDDDTLYEAIETARRRDLDAGLLLKETADEQAETAIIRRDDGRQYEVNAFVIPLFVHSTGGLKQERLFQDQPAFEALTASIQQGGLEGPDARVVLVAHAYHVEEADRIVHSHLNEMVRDAGAALLGKKSASMAALERSMSGWPPSYFEADDTALELRFLLGFALKRLDDAFYAIPADEDAADAYFEARQQRFQDWTAQARPLVQRCLGGGIEVDFLYQDLFFGGKERGIAEYYTLQLMSELNLDLQEHGTDAADTSAVIAPSDAAGEMVLQVNLYDGGGAMVATSERPLAALGSLEHEVADLCDALGMLGVASFMQASRFDENGDPIDPRPLDA